MTKRKFEEKYVDAIQGIIDGENDINVEPGIQGATNDTAVDMLKEMARKEDPTIYKGLPEGFDLKQCKLDLESITD